MNKLAKLAPPGSEEERLLAQLAPEGVPRHIAVIMDGNGRWARQRRLPRVAGHRAGIKAVREVVETSARLGLECLTLYAFSQENWKRPRPEVSVLMTLLQEFVRRELAHFVENNIRLRVIGHIQDLPEGAQDALAHALDATSKNDGLAFNIALSYGGRTEIVDACKAIVRQGIAADDVDVDLFGSQLYTSGQPDPDLLIRTSGEMRVSNFLLWQIAYSEIWVTDTLWPDFRCRHLLQALLDFQQRERRYGGLTNTSDPETPTAIRG